MTTTGEIFLHPIRLYSTKNKLREALAKDNVNHLPHIILRAENDSYYPVFLVSNTINPLIRKYNFIHL